MEGAFSIGDKAYYPCRGVAEVVGLESMDLGGGKKGQVYVCLLYTSPSPRDISGSRMPSSA